ncbi:MAG: HAD-IA family hydrolase [Pseudomonadota bacterium]|nr:HAD-IA family hydrolase [Pseudomonadota bacterium]
MFTRVRCVLFDLDGTLIDSAPDLARAADDMRVAFGITPETPAFASLREEFFTRYQHSLPGTTQPFDGIQPLIDTLRQQGRTWGVVTNKASRFTQPLTAAIPLFQTAATIISGDTTAHTKPHPAPLHEALRQAGVSPHEALYVGDDLRDIQAGRAAAIPTVAARYGYLGAGADITHWQADAIIDHPLQLLKLLDSA